MKPTKNQHMEDCFYLAQLASVNVGAAFLNLSPSSY